MRRTAWLALAAALVSVVPVTLVTPSVQASSLPPCPWANSNLRQCSVDATPRERGSIALLGDSVLLGSAAGMSTPGLPSMLSADGWGPVNLTATLGMRTRNNTNIDVSAWHWIDRWQRSGYQPSTIAVNLGGNHLSDCTLANTGPCRLRILELLDKIGPTSVVWWAKFTYYPFGGGPGAGMLAWNQALDEVATFRPNLIVWDWPTALATADPPISMDSGLVHPRSGVEYVKRSRLIAADLDATVGRAQPSGQPPSGAVAATAGNLSYEPLTTGTRIAGPLDRPGGQTWVLDVPPPPSGQPASAVALTVAVEPLAGLGFLTVYPCDITRTLVSNANFSPGVWGTVQAVVRLPANGRVCVFTNTDARVTVDVQGWFVTGSGLRLTPRDPSRLMDTRETGRSPTYELSIPGAAAVALNVVATEASAAGAFTFTNCEGLSPLAQSSYPPGGTVAGAMFLPLSADGRLCISGPTTADLVVDLTGVFSPDGQVGFTPAVTTRMLDTRDGVGGWLGRHGVGQTLDVHVAPPGAVAVTGTLTLVLPFTPGWRRANPCGGPTPVASAANTVPFGVAANSITVGISADQRLCIFAHANGHTLFDLAGWWSP